MNFEKETKTANGECEIVLSNNNLKEPYFEMLKTMLLLGDDVEEVRISFKQFEISRKQKQD